jgi:carbon monoxide dehydrogenase subunit G
VATFTLSSTVSAPIETVFDVLTDHRSYARLTPLRSSTLEREGSPDVNGVGAIRALKLAGPPIREEVTAFDAPTHFAYKALSGIPVKSHTGTVDLRSDGDRTRLNWVVDSVPRLPLPGAVWAAAVRPGIQVLLRGIVKESERRARAGG